MDDTKKTAVFSSLTKGPAYKIPPGKLGLALRAVGLFPSEAFVVWAPEDAHTLDGFLRLSVPDLEMSFPEALHAFSDTNDRTISLPQLMYALQGTGEPLPDTVADEILKQAQDKCLNEDGRVLIDPFIDCVNFLYSVNTK